MPHVWVTLFNHQTELLASSRSSPERHLGFFPVLQELKEVGKEQPKVEAELPANVSKNRYPHVLPCKCCLLPAPPSIQGGNSHAVHRDWLTLHRCRVHRAGSSPGRKLPLGLSS